MVDSSTPGDLLATKLFVPRPREGFVPRPRLAQHLEEGLSRTLTLVGAPAGSGKTALLADWSRRRGHPVAWLSLDDGDNDPVRFWRYVTAALDRVRPGVSDSVASWLRSPSVTAFEGVATAVINELADEAVGDTVLVLDDYHAIETASVHVSLSFLIDHAPPRFHLLLASRADPPLPLARLRARGDMAEVRAGELRFTESEAAELLRDQLGSDLDDDTVAALVTRTEGWAAGLQLAGLALRDHSDVGERVSTFSGSHRYVLDYLTEEVLDRQPPAIRQFLMETSILAGLSGPLCDVVTGRTDSRQVLEAIETANLFLVALDDERRWWRYHHLFADLLHVRLRQQWPEKVAQLHRNAATWYDEHGRADDAVRHALASGDAVWAARLIERYFDEFFLSSEGVTLQRLFSALPDELIGSRPRLLLARAGGAIRRGRVNAAQNLLDAAERAYHAAADEQFEPSVGRSASRLANVPAGLAFGRAYTAHMRGDADATIDFVSKALTERGDGEWMLNGLAHTNLAMAEWLHGRLGKAERAFEANIDRWRVAGENELATLHSRYLAQIQCGQGRLDAAYETFRRALEFAAAPDGTLQPSAGVARVGIAELAYQRGDLDVALHHVTEGLPLCRQFVDAQSVANGLATSARIRQSDGDSAGARDAMDEAHQIADPAVTDLLNPIPAQRARLLLVQGDIDAAARWTAERGLAADDELTYPQEPAYLVLARVLLAEGRPDQALGLLDRLHADAIAQDRPGSLIEIAALRARASESAGKDAEAVSALAEAIQLAQPHGHVRIFADEGQDLAVVLGRLISTRRVEPAAHDIDVGYLSRLARAFDRDAASSLPTPAVPGLVTQLSNRELEVLRLLAAGRPNRTIAADLYVTVNTVKKHITHIFDKVGATNRTEATARARALGLLD